MPKHLSVLIANEPGQLQKIAEILSVCSPPVNIWAHHLATAGRTGVVQMVCVPHQTALRTLSTIYGHFIAESEILAIRVPNEPGQLVKVLRLLPGGNLVSSYQTLDAEDHSVLILEFDNEAYLAVAQEIVSKAGYHVIEHFGEADGTGD